MTLWDIYKEYKHGEDFERHGISKVFRALKSHELQVFMVKDFLGDRALWNFVPEENKFEYVMTENI